MINITDITTGTIDGTGSFDKLMQVAKLHLMEEYKAERITGDKYAEVYMSVMNNVMAQSIQFSLQALTSNANEELIKQKIKTEKAQIEDTVDGVPVTGSIGKQKSVYDAQIKGFKDDALQKAAKMMVDVWNIQRSTDEAIAPNNQNQLHDLNIGNAVKALGLQVGFETDVLLQPLVQLEVSANTAKVYGSVGLPDSTLVRIEITDTATGKVIVNPVPDSDGNFIQDNIDITSLTDGTITSTLHVVTKEYVEMTATDSATKP